MATIDVSDKVAEIDRSNDVGMGHECLRPFGDALPFVGQEAASSNDDGEDLPIKWSCEGKESNVGKTQGVLVRAEQNGTVLGHQGGKDLGMDTILIGVFSGMDKSART